MTAFEQALVTVLQEIRDELRAFRQPIAIEDPGCPHPDDARMNLKAFGDPYVEHFKCRACGQLIQR